MKKYSRGYVWWRRGGTACIPNKQSSSHKGFSFHDVEYVSRVMHMNDSLRKKPKVLNNLKYYREKLGVTQQEMELHCNLSKGSWSDYEIGRNEPKIKLAQRFASELNRIAIKKNIDLKNLTTDDLYPP